MTNGERQAKMFLETPNQQHQFALYHYNYYVKLMATKAIKAEKKFM